MQLQWFTIFYIHGRSNFEHTRTVCSSTVQIPGFTQGICWVTSMQGTQRVSSYYKNLRATKFRLPPFLYKVISILFSNKAITLNTFPVLVFKRKAKKRNPLSFAFTSPCLFPSQHSNPKFCWTQVNSTLWCACTAPSLLGLDGRQACSAV